MISYASIRTPRTQAQVLAERIQDMQGISPVVQTGPGGVGSGLGTGRVLAAGVARASANVVVQITASGEPNDGVSAAAVSLDGGVSFGVPALITTAVRLVGTTGASLAFVAGLGGADPSFVAGELYSFSMSVPVWDSTAWQQFSAPRRLIDLENRDASLRDRFIAEVAAGGYLLDAVGPWLDLVAENVYDEERHQAVTSQRVLTLTDSAGIGPVTIGAGAIWARDTTGQLRWSNIAGGTIPALGSLQLVWQAEGAGVAWNLGIGAVTQLVTPIPGVTVTDDSYVTAPVASRVGGPAATAAIVGSLAGDYSVLVQITTGGALGAAVLRWSLDDGETWSASSVTMPANGVLALASSGVVLTFSAGTYNTSDAYTCTASVSSIAVSGAETESDDALRSRCQEKWATLADSSAAPSAAFEKWAKDASAQVTQALAVASNTTPGETDVYLAGAAGAVDAGVVAAVDAAVQPHVGLTETCVVASSTNQTVTLTGTVRVRAGLKDAAISAALSALAEYQAACPIGGYDLGGGSKGASREMLEACLLRGSQRSPVIGAVDLALTAPAADVAMTVPKALVLDLTGLTWEEV